MITTFIRFFATLFAALIAVAMAGCGGGGAEEEVAAEAPAAAPISSAKRTVPISFDVRYDPAVRNWLEPNGLIDVGPTDDRMTLGTADIAKVELLLFGYQAQVMTSPNSQRKDNPQLHYHFAVPSDFGPDSYRCGSGEHLSEVRVTDVNGVTLSTTFELCPGIAFETSAPSVAGQ